MIMLVSVVTVGLFAPAAVAYDLKDSGALLAAEDSGPPATARTTLLYFRAEGCPACARASEFLEELSRRYPDLEVRDYEVSQNRANLKLYRSVAGERGAGAGVVPAFFLGEHHWAGFSETVRQEINAVLDDGRSISGALRPYLDLPWFGRVDYATAPAFVVTGVIAAVDGFNPCSLWVLFFLLGLVVRGGSRLHTLFVGLVFLTVTATVYGLFILGLFSVLSTTTGVTAVRLLVALLAVGTGLVNIKDYLAVHAGFSLSIPKRFHPMIARGGRAILSVGDAPILLTATTAIFALGISVVELPCTAGFPLIWSQYVATLDLTRGGFAVLLSVYLLVYLSLEIVIVTLSVLFMKRVVFGENQGRVLKLFGGTIMVALGITFLGAPGAVHTAHGLGIIVVGALGMGVLAMYIPRLSSGGLAGVATPGHEGQSRRTP